MRHFPLLAATLAALSACTPVPNAEVTKSRPLPGPATDTLTAPAFVDPSAQLAPVASVGHSNADMSAAFMELGFQLESGRQLPYFSRFEGPITVALAGNVPASAGADLDRLLNRFRNEAGLNVRRVSAGQPASVTIEFSPRRELRRAAPNAACFVVPNVSSLAEYQANRGTYRVDWTQVRERKTVGIFAPSDASPQEVRDCLHEELAQAMGPLNDLYRLTDSVFNDDNFQTVLTGFDMKILRAWYSPQLKSGMSRADVAAKIGGIFGAIHGGGSALTTDTSATSPAWNDTIAVALNPGFGAGKRKAAAERAITMAHAQGWRDGRLAFAYFAHARLLVGPDRAAAVAEFNKASAIYRGLPGGALYVAHIDMQLAAIAVASGQPDQALRYTDRAIPVIRRAENHGLLATTQLIRAQALDQVGRSAEANRLRVDSQALARYGFGSEAQIRARTNEISALGTRGLFRG
ncbi:DUF2927 domain-containing protein [Xinfangfangia sp. D13-10-4-6]|uniref:DUF2927 domain-containing protein n=1 Tax=Pseudogemmobacter hezensis TaxID=2737662 RepID=UPI001556D082|nr:DUF2927 domain-containing protein [Pseudogemmobacter hezensis]NPD14501.1 DUF2927 domain-containing protein [Pseudogemmobacter hezensis]